MAAFAKRLAAGVVQWTPKTEVEATSILPSLNGKTARSWRAIVPATHLAREGAYDSHHWTAGIAGHARRRAARAQQPAMPVVGFLYGQSPDAFVDLRSFFRQGLKEAGFVEGENVAIADRWAENQPDRLTALAA